MNRQQARRKIRKRKSTSQNSRMKFGTFLGIIVLAVFLGFLTARFVVGPLIGYDADESPARAASDEKEKSTGEKDKDEKEVSAELEKGYALQFGAFSTEDAAQDLADNLKSSGITAEIIQDDDIYKVIGPILSTKEKALEALASLPENSVQDVFIASFK
ncbi:MAG: SPOR domain-containing protein [Firmicutes bacterium]|nr:SPOR domain-containing protein [Bacillota bacterium]